MVVSISLNRKHFCFFSNEQKLVKNNQTDCVKMFEDYFHHIEINKQFVSFFSEETFVKVSVKQREKYSIPSTRTAFKG